MTWNKNDLSDLFFLIFAISYLFVRKWPFGGGLQTAADILILLALLLMIVTRRAKKHKADNPAQKKTKNNHK